jgi:hypothetical protein
MSSLGSLLRIIQREMNLCGFKIELSCELATRLYSSAIYVQQPTAHHRQARSAAEDKTSTDILLNTFLHGHHLCSIIAKEETCCHIMTLTLICVCVRRVCVFLCFLYS